MPLRRETKVERMRRYGKEKNERRKKDLDGVTWPLHISRFSMVSHGTPLV